MMDQISVPLLQECVQALERDGLFGFLRTFNATTPYRFTGIYRFEGHWVKSVRLFDRERPDVEFGSDVLWDDSYCRMASTSGEVCEIVDALQDQRLTAHAARECVQSYLAVVLRNRDHSHYGTLCHYDVIPRRAPEGALEHLCLVRPFVEQVLTAALPFTPDHAPAVV